MTLPLTLALEASTYEGSAALLRGGEVVAERTVAMRGERSERLMPAVAELLEGDGGGGRKFLAGVIVGGGPGSFTSLRIAASIAKGIALAYGVPLHALSSLLLLAGRAPRLPAGRYLASLDAMRGDRFAAVIAVDGQGRATQEDPSRLVSAEQLADWARREGVARLGPGCEIDAHPHARGAALALAHAVLAPVDLAAWEPDYGRHAEAQVRWETAHGRRLGTA